MPGDAAHLLIGLGLGYAAGSIPFGYLLTRAAGKGDVRGQGSGNIGATNVLRTGSRPLAAATLLADIAKGLIPVAIMQTWGTGAPGALIPAMAAGAAALAGHIFPVWLKFRGGKGVATYIGALAGLAWPAALVFIAAWLACAVLTRLSSLSALVATLAVPVFLAWRGDWALCAFCLGLGAVIYFTHRQNIARLLAGTEPRIGSET